ncbi:MAG: Adenylate kinase [uncultured Chloroflexia bacterium]|uniref:Adenylate kinase n=1 Tax=uncultured Chloroflexia bacterium TaxID=1672391 RepID=A0A6J4I3W7_9CHLR|nr:MAG: Adenylate kinase [uncultured Chloroflexia bacterium]
MSHRYHVILLGAPGAGKSTQSRLLSARFAMDVFATGQMLRDEVKRGTALGLLANGYFKKGTLLPDEVMIAVMTERLRAVPHARGVLLDGFPRTEAQAEALDEILEPLGRRLTSVIALGLSDQEAVHRLGGRRMCEGLGDPFPLHIDDTESVNACLRLGGRIVTRHDDEPEVILERLRVYDAETEPLLGFYERRGLLRRIPAAGTPADVNATIVALLEAAGAAQEQSQ